jgi:glutaconate CoA-transferase subunit B
VRLPGGGGAAVMMPTAKRVVTWRTEHSPRTLVDKLDFVTGAGNMATLVTPLGVFQRATQSGSRFRLAEHNPEIDPLEIARRTGFAFDARSARVTDPMTDAEHDSLEALDAGGLFSRGTTGA